MGWKSRHLDEVNDFDELDLETVVCIFFLWFKDEGGYWGCV